MTAFAIVFGPRERRRYLAPNRAPAGGERSGWRPFVWTKDRACAELFSSEARARELGRAQLGHDLFGVAIVPPTVFPEGDTGGTPAALAA